MRFLATLIHRWAGLFIALFLIVSGLTGAVISWDHEIDEWLNSHLYETDSRGPYHDPLELVRIIEQDDPHAQVVYVPLQFEEGHNSAFVVQPRIDPATRQPYPIGYSRVFVDPVTARIMARTDPEKISLSRETLMPFLRELHYNLHFPRLWGIDRWGYWLMGIVALVWLLDSFVAICLTLPRRRQATAGRHDARALSSLDSSTGNKGTAPGWWTRWKPAWRIRWRVGAYKLNFDLHRAAGLWIWGIILVIAFTSFSLNLYREVFYPAMSLISQVTPGPFETRTVAPFNEPVEPAIGFARILQQADEQRHQQGWDKPIAGIFYARSMGFYSVAFFHPGEDHGSGGMAIANMYFDGQTGEPIGDYQPWKGSAADIFVQLQFPMHSGRILGITGRIMMSVMGLLVAMLSVTGIVIWMRKRRSRRLAGMRANLA